MHENLYKCPLRELRTWPDPARHGKALQVVQVRWPVEAVLLPLVRQEPLRIHN